MTEKTGNIYTRDQFTAMVKQLVATVNLLPWLYLKAAGNPNWIS